MRRAFTPSDKNAPSMQPQRLLKLTVCWLAVGLSPIAFADQWSDMLNKNYYNLVYAEQAVEKLKQQYPDATITIEEQLGKIPGYRASGIWNWHNYYIYGGLPREHTITLFTTEYPTPEQYNALMDKMIAQKMRIYTSAFGRIYIFDTVLLNNRPNFKTPPEPFTFGSGFKYYHYMQSTREPSSNGSTRISYAYWGNAGVGVSQRQISVYKILAPGIASDALFDTEKSNTGMVCAQSAAGTNPCNAGTGHKFQREVDYVGTGPFPLSLVRVYNSGGTTPEVVEATHWGAHWNAGLDRAMVVSDASTVSVRRADAKEFTFRLVDGVWTGDGDVVGRLSGDAVSDWIYTNAADEVERYNSRGQLESVTNSAGLSQTLTYDAQGHLETVSDPFGRTLTFYYDAQDRVREVIDPAGSSFVYTYDADNNLASVTYPDGGVREYVYGEAGLVSESPASGVRYTHSLTGMIDNGVRYASWAYDADGRAILSEHGAIDSEIDRVEMVYNEPDAEGNRVTQVTDVLGVTRDYTFSTVQGMVRNTGIEGEPCLGCTASYGYDDNANIISRTDFNGNTTCIHYNARNLPIIRLEGLAPGNSCPADLASYTPSGNTERLIRTRWHADYRLPTEVAAPLQRTVMQYDAQGNLNTLTQMATADNNGSQGFNAGQVGEPRRVSFAYNDHGQVIQRDGPRSDVMDVTDYRYQDGVLVNVINALGHESQLSDYDAHGRPGKLIDANGRITVLGYDARGRLAHSSTGSETNHYRYDANGNLQQVSYANGAVFSYGYDDAHRLVRIEDGEGNWIRYTLDPAGNRTAETVYDRGSNVVYQHRREFDTLNRLWKDIGAYNQTTVYSYDHVGNVTQVSDAAGSSVNQYDALNRLIRHTAADNGVSDYDYDGQDQLISVSDPRQLVTAYVRDGLGRLSQTTSPDTGISTQQQDAAGNVLQHTDAKGQVVRYQYDALNRVTQISYDQDSQLNVVYEYDQGNNALGRLSRMQDHTGSTAYFYNDQGRLVMEQRTVLGLSYRLAYQYDAQGRLTGYQYPSGRWVNYDYDGIGRVVQVRTTVNDQEKVIASDIQYQPFGGLRSLVFGNGQLYQRDYDADGRISGYSFNQQPVSLSYDLAGRLDTLTHGSLTADYDYDSMGRLTGMQLGSALQGFDYDQVGNRLSHSNGSLIDYYTPADSSNQLASLQQGDQPATPFQYDANGATLQDAKHQYSYDARGRLIEVETDNTIINYTLNAQGQRVRKQVSSSGEETLFHYNASGQLIAEGPPNSDAFDKEYLYLGNLPLAVLKP